jgi:hypothetical protein
VKASLTKRHAHSGGLRAAVFLQEVFMVKSAPIHRSIKQRNRTGAWSTFQRRFKPQLNEDGREVLVPVHALPKGIDAAHVWTVIDEDGHLYAFPGFRFVNRFAFVICAQPWLEADQDQPPYLYD